MNPHDDGMTTNELAEKGRVLCEDVLRRAESEQIQERIAHAELLEDDGLEAVRGLFSLAAIWLGAWAIVGLWFLLT